MTRTLIDKLQRLPPERQAEVDAVRAERRGRIVTRLEPSPSAKMAEMKPWEQLRGLGGQLSVKPGASVLRDEDFEALR